MNRLAVIPFLFCGCAAAPVAPATGGALLHAPAAAAVDSAIGNPQSAMARPTPWLGQYQIAAPWQPATPPEMWLAWGQPSSNVIVRCSTNLTDWQTYAVVTTGTEVPIPANQPQMFFK